MTRSIITIFCLMFLASCATPYQDSGVRGGVKAVQLSETTWHIESNANGYTSAGLTQDYAFRKAAEITLEQGYTSFVVRESDLAVNPDKQHIYTGLGIMSVSIDKPSAKITIDLLNEVGSEIPRTRVFNAKALLLELTTKKEK